MIGVTCTVGLADTSVGLAKISWDSQWRKLRVPRTRKYRGGGKTLYSIYNVLSKLFICIQQRRTTHLRFRNFQIFRLKYVCSGMIKISSLICRICSPICGVCSLHSCVYVLKISANRLMYCSWDAFSSCFFSADYPILSCTDSNWMQ